MNTMLLDLGERVLWTFLQALGGSVLAAATLGQFDGRAALLGAGGAAAGALAKWLALRVTARAVSDTDAAPTGAEPPSSATLPRHAAPDQPAPLPASMRRP